MLIKKSMNRKLFFFIALPFAMLSCSKSSNDCNSTGVPNAEEIATLQSYLTNNSITAIQDPGGFFYQIIAAGSGTTPMLSSKVSVRYTGKLLNGTVFDSNTSGPLATFTLSGVIRGWQLGVPLIKKGGSINLYLPPSLAYGCNGNGPVPGNASLVFNINLIDVQ
jgi:FKBP-type peptidyl-prolyl cis-trans isomerase FkpA